MQASSLKEYLEELSINKSKYSITLIHIVNFYPSVSYKMIEWAVQFFEKRLLKDEKKKLKTSLEIVKIRMPKQII